MPVLMQVLSPVKMISSLSSFSSATTSSSSSSRYSSTARSNGRTCCSTSCSSSCSSSLFSSSNYRGLLPPKRRKNQISLASTNENVEPSDAPGEGKKRFPLLAEESRHSRSEPRKYKHPQNEGCAVTYSFDTDAFGNFKVVEICEDGVVKPMDAPGEGKKRAPEAMQEREKDDGWDAKKGHGLMFGYVEERNPDNAC
ncbi:unnamed protein product [Bathycoccus prasinos]